jgi:hypothetical protein
LSRIKSTVDRFEAADFVLDAQVTLETRPGEQGYVAGSIAFVDGSVLHFKEFLDADRGTVEKLTYSYHYQNADDELIFRYDNARHRPLLPSLEHKHTPAGVVETLAPTLDDVLSEIASGRGWL